jgi:DNA anti-recombination protein RmuC
MMTQKKTNGYIQIFFILIISGVALSACTQPADNPKTVADRYWQFIQTGNTVEAEKLISVNSRRAYSENNHRRAAIERFSNDEAITIVSTSITTISPHSNFSRTQTFDTYLVLQQGQWKIDANRTQMPPAPSATEEELQKLAEELSESMQDNIESIDETMNQGMQMLNEALRDGSKEMGDSLLQLMNELNKSMRDSIDKMKQRRQEQLQEQAPQPNQPDPDKGEGMI